jgi:predicted nucleic acid-binding protein
VLLDTSVIIEIFRSSAKSEFLRKNAIEIGDEEAYVSAFQVAERADWATRKGVSPEERVEAVKEILRIVPLNQRICFRCRSR